MSELKPTSATTAMVLIHVDMGTKTTKLLKVPSKTATVRDVLAGVRSTYPDVTVDGCVLRIVNAYGCRVDDDATVPDDAYVVSIGDSGLLDFYVKKWRVRPCESVR